MAELLFLSPPGSRERYEYHFHRIRDVLLVDRYAERDELQRQFVENDLTATGGPRKGQPMAAKGRAQRLKRMFETHDAIRDLEAERDCIEHHLKSLREENLPASLFGADIDPEDGA